MSKIIFNKRLSQDFFLLKASFKGNIRMGQFFMLRAWDSYPVLSRPISVFDCDDESATFLYKVVGEGTQIFSNLRQDDEITLQGPYGNGFDVEKLTGKIAMVGGGVGIAPFYLAAKHIKAQNPAAQVDIFLGFSDKPLLVDEFKQVANNVAVDVGGYITDKINPCDYDNIITCGPEIMMCALYKKYVAEKSTAALYVSMENRMACGIGACLVCSCKTIDGNKKACKDGPVFEAKAVFGL